MKLNLPRIGEIEIRRLGAHSPPAEHPVADRPPFLGRPWSAWILAFLSLLLGGAVSAYSETIKTATRWAALSFFGLRDKVEFVQEGVPMVATDFHVAWGVVWFWFFGVVWTVLLAVRLRTDDEVSRQQRMSIIRAVHRAPNLLVVRDYPAFYRKVSALLSAEPAGDLEAVSVPIRKTLSLLAEMARTFTREDGATYSANIMLGLDYASVLPEHLEVLKFNGDTDLATLLGVLSLPNGLRSTMDADVGVFEPVIALPVAARDFDEQERRYVLPGAPWTMRTGKPGTYEDTRSIGTYCADFSRPVREEIETYFTTGAGKEYRSFASFRLEAGGVPIGVLNIDSSHPYVLGGFSEFYVTFYALIEPVLHLLAPHVVVFAEEAYASLLTASRLKQQAQAADTPAAAPPTELPASEPS